MRIMPSSNKGFTVIAALVAVLFLAGIGAGMAYFVSTNQQSSIQQVTSDQSFYSTHAGIEYTLAQIDAGNQASSITKNFLGEPINITRASNLVTVNTTRINARNVDSITDPSPPDPTGCLVVTSSAAAVATNVLSGITINRGASCGATLTINSMSTTSWTPNLSENLTQINIGGTTYFSGSAASGGNSLFSPALALTDSSTKALVMTWNKDVTSHIFNLVFNFTYNSVNYSKTVTVNLMAANQANCFVWNTGSAQLNFTNSLWEQVINTTIQNTCNNAIRLASVAVTWAPSSSANLNIVQVNAVNIFNGTAANGATAVADNPMPALTTQTLNFLQFDADMTGKNYSVVWTFVDGTSKTTTLDIFNSAQNNCLTINTTSSSRSTTDILGVTIQNTCALDIAITGATMSWAGETTRRFTRAEIFDIRAPVNIYTGSFASGATMNFSTAGPAFGNIYLTDGSGVKNVQLLRFATAITAGLQFTLTFTMSDGTTKSVTFIPGAQNNCLSVNTSAAILSNVQKDISGITITNNCGFTITWSTTVVAWTPTSPTRNLKQIRVANSTVFNGTAASGVTVNNTDVTLTASQTKLINWFRFDASMSARTFTIQIRMSDSTVKTFTVGPL